MARIKPIVWIENSPQNGMWFGASVLGPNYIVSSMGSWRPAYDLKYTKAGSIEEAKLAAEKDYESRIDAALQSDAEDEDFY